MSRTAATDRDVRTTMGHLFYHSVGVSIHVFPVGSSQLMLVAQREHDGNTFSKCLRVGGVFSTWNAMLNCFVYGNVFVFHALEATFVARSIC